MSDFRVENKEHQVEMSQEKTLRDFLKSLLISLKNASIYSCDHPAFKKSIDDLSGKVVSLLNFSNPLHLGFTPRSLFVNGDHLENESLFRDFARVFHFRKVKSLEIRKGITKNELNYLLSQICLPQRKIIREGGLANIINRAEITHISLEDLDYSELLQGEGKEIKDIWTYVLLEAVEKLDHNKINEVADSFERVIGEFDPEDIVDDEELHDNFQRFFAYLKEKDDEKFRNCARELIKTIMIQKSISEEEKLKKLKLLVTDLKEEDFASTLWEEIITDDDFDSLSFSIFSKLIDRDRHKEIASSFNDIFREKSSSGVKPQVKEKIKDLLSGTSNPFISEIYHRTLASLLEDISFDKELTFDYDLLSRNYWFLLLNFLEKEDKKDKMVGILEEILNEWGKIIEDKDTEYLKYLSQVLEEKRGDLYSEPKFIEVTSNISEFIENEILEGGEFSDFEYFVSALRRSLFGVNHYFKKIFEQNCITPFILRLFFKFFQEYMLYFYINLEQKSSDKKLILKFIESLKLIDSPSSLETLKSIFSLGKNSTRTKVLEAMQYLSEYDEDFLLPILKKGDMSLRREALVILMRNESTKQKAMERLFLIQSPFGIRNKYLIENLRIVKEKNFVETKTYLVSLAERKSLWNKKVKEKTLRILEKWDVRQN